MPSFSNDDYRTKYRPRRYDQMWQGLEFPAIKRLRREEELLRYPRGSIFCGEFGTGKTTAARIRGMRTSCWNYKLDPCEPCGECAGCRAAMKEGDGPDYFEMDATQTSLRQRIDQALNKSSIAKVHSHPRMPRVFFIDEAHRADAKTQETLLKDIEDHQEALFILSTTQPEKLDPAIRKRCTIYHWVPTKAEVAAERLEHFAKLEHLKLEPGAALRICEAKRGVPRDCLGVMYDLSFDGNDISLAQVEAYLGVGQ